MTDKLRVGRAESEVLRFVAEHCPATVREVADHFSEKKNYTKTTVLNMMERLREKGLLMRESVDGLFRYSPTRPASTILRDLVRDFVDEMLGGSLEPFAAYLAAQPKVTDSEIARLRETVALLRSSQLASDNEEEKS